LTAACCPRRDLHTHTPLKNDNRLLYCILKKHVICTAYSKKHVICTAYSKKHVICTQKSTQKDFGTAYSKKDIICTAYSKKHLKSRQKKVAKRQQKRRQKSWQKNQPKKHIATYTTHMLIIRKNFLKHILEPVMLLS